MYSQRTSPIFSKRLSHVTLQPATLTSSDWYSTVVPHCTTRTTAADAKAVAMTT